MSNPYSPPHGLTLFTEDMIQRQIGPNTYVAESAPEFSALVKRLFFNIVDSFSIWNRRRVIEAELYALSPHMLEDIGVEPGAIPMVAAKWAKAEGKRHLAERLDDKAAMATKVAPFTPATAAPATSVRAANDHTHSVAA